MGRKSKEITVEYYMGDKQITEITPEQWRVMSARLTETMSRYYSEHPDEWDRIKDTLPDAPANYGAQV